MSDEGMGITRRELAEILESEIGRTGAIRVLLRVKRRLKVMLRDNRAAILDKAGFMALVDEEVERVRAKRAEK